MPHVLNMQNKNFQLFIKIKSQFKIFFATVADDAGVDNNGGAGPDNQEVAAY